MRKKNKEPGLFRQIIAIHYEQVKRRKAIRTLEKVDWSIDFLTEVICKAADIMHKDVIIELETKAGHKMTLSSVKGRNATLNTDDDIFNQLDNDAALERFIREHSRR